MAEKRKGNGVPKAGEVWRLWHAYAVMQLWHSLTKE